MASSVIDFLLIYRPAGFEHRDKPSAFQNQDKPSGFEHQDKPLGLRTSR